MEKKTKKIALIGGGLALAAGLAYWYYKSQQAAAAPSTTTTDPTVQAGAGTTTAPAGSGSGPMQFNVPSNIDLSIPASTYNVPTIVNNADTAVLAKYPSGSLVRSTNVDHAKVFLINNLGHRQWIPTRDLFLNKYGFNFNAVKVIPDADMIAITQDDNLSGLRGLRGLRGLNSVPNIF